LDTAKLLTAFQQFFRKNSEHWVERFDYKSARLRNSRRKREALVVFIAARAALPLARE
jgi:hypothetical protein